MEVSKSVARRRTSSSPVLHGVYEISPLLLRPNSVPGRNETTMLRPRLCYAVVASSTNTRSQGPRVMAGRIIIKIRIAIRISDREKNHDPCRFQRSLSRLISKKGANARNRSRARGWGLFLSETNRAKLRCAGLRQQQRLSKTPSVINVTPCRLCHWPLSKESTTTYATSKSHRHKLRSSWGPINKALSS